MPLVALPLVALPPAVPAPPLPPVAVAPAPPAPLAEPPVAEAPTPPLPLPPLLLPELVATLPMLLMAFPDTVPIRELFAVAEERLKALAIEELAVPPLLAAAAPAADASEEPVLRFEFELLSL
ncbi:hypothetical protein [Massilia sp. TWP1-3-3]|uniref:hypothetical protein n=1 Tax=Massilia sp. TWP1-3-3 TaxID=2804573 RepID=UPI003CEA6E9B